ncbi:universal stress protein [Desulfonema magnum]|uniref:Universal stress protein family protein n=1 Tax=Desulfonema magnum TaxID=45655 RepID=A0A975GNA4_9BACT|nr:universal stress protein [Desulfonema magnum]QTA87761.1 Universal stress protein family protein [Desulfonema magnum]
MEEIKKILVAIAFSEYAKGIFNYAAKLATTLNADLIVANIINSRDVEAVGSIVSLGYEVNGDNYVRDIKKERQQVMEQIIKESSFPWERIRIIFKVGNPIDELLKIIIKEKADMIVMGPKGRTDVEHILVGSVAEKMFRRSPVTIVSYRDEKHMERLKRRIHLK